MAWYRTDAGQASVELVALLPLLVCVAVGVFCVLGAARAHELAAHAAGAGAMALLQDRDPERAARESIPGHSAHEARIVVRGRVVEVTVRPRLPVQVLSARLAATESADAGPPPSP